MGRRERHQAQQQEVAAAALAPDQRTGTAPAFPSGTVPGVADTVQVLPLVRRDIDIEHFIDPLHTRSRKYKALRGARESDVSSVVAQSTVIVDPATGRARVVYLRLDDNDDEYRKLVPVLQRIPFKRQDRSSGMIATTRTFGFQPRLAIRHDWCSAAALAVEHPGAHALITSYAMRVARYYEQFHPELFAEHNQMVERVLPEWRMQGSPFTSGIINQNNVLPYHYDAGNFRNVWSNMLAFKQHVGGGYLAIPEYDLALEISNNSLTMFDGQNLLHGVTPMRKLKPSAYRYTIVYYALQGMWKCLPPGDELRRAQQVRTDREFKRLRGETAAQRMPPPPPGKRTERPE